MPKYTASNTQIAERLEKLAAQIESRSEAYVYYEIAAGIRRLPYSLSETFSARSDLPSEFSHLDLKTAYWVEKSITSSDPSLEWTIQKHNQERVDETYQHTYAGLMIVGSDLKNRNSARCVNRRRKK